MIRPGLCSCVVAATLACASSAFAFEPVAFTDVPDLVGKQVFAGINFEVGSAWAYAGEPLMLVAAPPVKRDGKTSYQFVRVKTAEGKEADVQLRFLSKAALKFNLRDPGTARQLVLAILADAYELPAKMHEIRSKFHYDIDSTEQPDEYHQVQSLAESFKFQRMLLHGLVHSALTSKEMVLRNQETRWIVQASDGAILDWYVNGIQDKAVKTKLENADLALRTLDGVSSLASNLARLEKEKTDKPWRRRVKDVPEDKLVQLDAENLAKIDKETERFQKLLKDVFALAKTSRARAQ